MMRAETREVREFSCDNQTLSLQVLVVTGGYSTVPLDSTEMMMMMTGTWNILTTASLPTGRWKPAAATINNRVYLFVGE